MSTETLPHLPVQHEMDAAASWNPAFRPEDASAIVSQPSHITQPDAQSTALETREEVPDVVAVEEVPIQEHNVEPAPESEKGEDDKAEQLPATAWEENVGDQDDFFNNLGSGTEVATTEFTEAVQPQTLVAEEPEPSPAPEVATHESLSAEVIGALETKESHKDTAVEDDEEEEEEEEVDPAWGLKRGDSDTFKILGQIDRTTSFPTFISPQSESMFPTEQETVAYQAQHNEQDINGFTDLNTEKQPESSVWPGTTETKTVETEDASFFDHFSQSVPANEPSDAEARFEEGLPLVSENHEDEKTDGFSSTMPRALDDLFSSEPDGADVSFFDQQVQVVSQETEAPSFHRKDTFEVLSSMHFESHGSETKDASVPVQSTDIPVAAKEEDLDAMWKAALDDDDLLVGDDDFLPDDDDGLLSDDSEGSKGSFFDQLKSGDQAAPAQPPITQRSTSSYTPHQPSTAELSQPFIGSPYGSHATVTRPSILPTQFGSSMSQQQLPEQPKAQSFVDQAKGGYQSPYDLPTDLTARPKRRVQMQPSTQSLQSTGPPPPPRSASMTSDKGIPPPQRQSSQSGMNFNSSRPGTASSGGLPTINGAQPSLKSVPSNASFFEELPVASRPRPANQGRYTPMQPAAAQTPPPPAGVRSVSTSFSQPPTSIQPVAEAPPTAFAPPPTSITTAPAPMPAPATTAAPPNPYSQFGLQKPELLDPYANTSTLSPAAAAPSIPAASRYSPAPPAQAGPRINPSPRYSPAPPPQPLSRPTSSRYVSQPPAAVPQTSAALHFQPRTSSPLAYHERPLAAHPHPATPIMANTRSPPVSPPSKSGVSPYSQQVDPSLHHERQVSNQSSQGLPSSVGSTFAPLRRSQTQSPGKMDAAMATFTSPSQPPVPRPASVQGQAPMLPSAAAYNAQPMMARQRAPSLNQNFISPTDGSQFDELQRWRGGPIFHFTPGGAIVSSFPKHVPRYVAGQVLPLIKPTPGQPRVRTAKEVLNTDSQAARFPGPLRSKSKKKEVLSWLSDRIALLEQQVVDGSAELPDPQVSHDEKVLLWKILKVYVEFDGIIEGKPDAQKAITTLLAPELNAPEVNGVQFSPTSTSSGIYRAIGTEIRPAPVDMAAVEQVRKNLIRGDREKAVWDAVDGRLWPHAMLIASTMEKSIWKQVAQEFVRQEVKTAGENTESLAALYQIFAGNLEDSIDELVPPSARAGLQMVSKVTSNGPTKNALDGLNKWRETLSLVINNRSAEDHQAIFALGRLLATYGRIPAAHICFILSRTPASAIFGGIDEPQASVVLLGADHVQTAFEISNDEDAIILTEVYEFATSILANNNNVSAALPYLQSYKLQRAIMLSENGYKSEALQYCEAISGSLKSSTKMSPYHHPLFFAELDELSNQLRQAPVEASSSWKPSVEKMSGSLLSKFNSFVNGGDDTDTASVGSGKDGHELLGPFAKVAGTPSISREPSSVDLYSSYTTGGSQPIPIAAATGRYAPNNQYAPRTSSEQLRKPPVELGRSPSYAAVQRSPSFEPGSYGAPAFVPPVTPSLGSPYQGIFPPQPQSSSPVASYMPAVRDSPPENPYERKPSLTQSPYQPMVSQQPQAYMPSPHPDQFATSSPEIPKEPEPESAPSFGGYEPPINSSLYMPQEPSSNPEESFDSQPVESSYPSYGGYEPPAGDTGYVPYEPEPDSDSENVKGGVQKKKSFMDIDDDEPVTRATPPPASKPVNKDLDRAKKDAEVDAAFRAAAEADAQRGQPTLKSKGSWFGGWFAGKGEAEPKDMSSASAQKVYKAKLGEESSFYYDKDLKKWVNKKDPGSATTSAKATPPPPKGPLPRSASGLGPPRPASTSSGPPGFGLSNSASLPSLSGPPSRTQSPVVNGSPLAGPPTSLQPPGPPSGPPSRSVSGTASPAPPRPKVTDIDDLLGGPPMPRKGTPAGSARAAKKKRGGYVDIMAQK